MGGRGCEGDAGGAQCEHGAGSVSGCAAGADIRSYCCTWRFLLCAFQRKAGLLPQSAIASGTLFSRAQHGGRGDLCGYLCAGACMRPSGWRTVSCILDDGSHRDGGYICPESAVFLLQLCGNAGSGHADGQAVDDALCACSLFQLSSAAPAGSDRLFCRFLSDDLREYRMAVDKQQNTDIKIYIAVGLLYDMGKWQGGRCGRRDRAMAEYYGDLSAGGDYGAALLSGACALPVSKK